MTRRGLTDAQLSALERLVDLWGVDKLVLIGARALGCFVPLTWRRTADLDLTVSISLDEYPGRLEKLPGWRQDPRVSQRWYAEQGVRLDLLPIGPAGRADSIDWPGEDRSFNTVGLRLAEEHARLLPLSDELSLRVAPVPVLSVLKMISYQDQPHVRERDLRDLAHVLVEYPDDEVRFKHLGTGDLDYDEVGPFVLGKEIAALKLLPVEAQLVTRFLDLVDRQEAVAAKLSREIGRTDVAEVRRLANSLREGLSTPS